MLFNSDAYEGEMDSVEASGKHSEERKFFKPLTDILTVNTEIFMKYFFSLIFLLAACSKGGYLVVVTNLSIYSSNPCVSTSLQ